MPRVDRFRHISRRIRNFARDTKSFENVARSSLLPHRASRRSSARYGYNPGGILILSAAPPHLIPITLPRSLATLAVAVFLVGCAGTNPRDPLEPFNRVVYKANDALDRAILKPVAKGYRAAVPLPIRSGVSNLLDNLRDVPTALNGVLQGRFRQAASDTGRFVINSSIGILGIFDVASHMGLQKHDEDFGQTLGLWGLGSGPYLMLPLLGPSTVRDGSGLIVDFATTPATYAFKGGTQGWTALGVRIVDQRASLLDAERILEEAALDRYYFLRDAYLQRRERLIHDGQEPSKSQSPEAAPRRKTLKELEEELAEAKEGAPAGSPASAPAKPR